jgi:hypothetical protein
MFIIITTATQSILIKNLIMIIILRMSKIRIQVKRQSSKHRQQRQQLIKLKVNLRTHHYRHLHMLPRLHPLHLLKQMLLIMMKIVLIQTIHLKVYANYFSIFQVPFLLDILEKFLIISHSLALKFHFLNYRKVKYHFLLSSNLLPILCWKKNFK